MSVRGRHSNGRHVDRLRDEANLEAALALRPLMRLRFSPSEDDIVRLHARLDCAPGRRDRRLRRRGSLDGLGGIPVLPKRHLRWDVDLRVELLRAA